MYGLERGDPYRILYGSDSFGNTCGRCGSCRYDIVFFSLSGNTLTLPVSEIEMVRDTCETWMIWLAIFCCRRILCACWRILCACWNFMQWLASSKVRYRFSFGFIIDITAASHIYCALLFCIFLPDKRTENHWKIESGVDTTGNHISKAPSIKQKVLGLYLYL